MPEYALSKVTKIALKTLGEMIKAARKSQSVPQRLLAERLGISVKTVTKIEKGQAGVAIGTVFEAADILGVPLLSSDPNHLQQWHKTLLEFNAILPNRTQMKDDEIDDNF
jgi:transcriptional regulator with XRE-family HTH domain